MPRRSACVLRDLPVEGLVRREFMQEVETIEGQIRARLPIGTMVSEKRLVDDLLGRVMTALQGRGPWRVLA